MRGPVGPTGATGPAGPARTLFSWIYSNGVGSTATRYVQAASTLTLNNESGGRLLVVQAATLVRISVRVTGAAPYSTDSVTYTLRKNSVDTGLTVTLAAGATSATATGSVAVVPGDILTLKLVQSGSEATAAINPYIYVSDA